MGEVWDAVIEGSKQLGEMIGWGGVTGDSNKTKRRRRAAMEAAKPRKPANVDDAAARQIETDRLSRRRGVLANIYGGSTGAQPSVAVKQALGQ